MFKLTFELSYFESLFLIYGLAQLDDIPHKLARLILKIFIMIKLVAELYVVHLGVAEVTNTKLLVCAL